jgi:hypothetical protein
LEVICTDIAELFFDASDSVLHIKLIEGAKINLKNCSEHFKLIRKITKNKKYVSLIDATDFFTIEKEALRLCAGKTKVNVIAASYYTANLANKLTANFFIAFYKPAIPVSLFKSKSEALAWLQQKMP